jgi:hypothetical protein
VVDVRMSQEKTPDGYVAGGFYNFVFRVFQIGINERKTVVFADEIAIE